jgi:hypothetical protein
MIFTNIGIIRTAMRSNILFISSRKQKRNNRLTIMLLSVILAFMLLTCPSVIYICLNRLLPSTGFSDRKLVALDLLESLWYTKHALNFILYTLSGQDFRREFRRLISCSKRTSSNPSRNHRQGENNNNNQFGPTPSTASTYPSTSITIRMNKSNKRQQYDTEKNLLDANTLLNRTMDDGESSLDGAFALLNTYSNRPSPTSFTSEQ